MMDWNEGDWKDSPEAAAWREKIRREPEGISDGLWKALAIAVPLGLLFWIGAIWLVWRLI